MKNILLIIVDCARAEKTVAAIPDATKDTERSAALPFLDALQRNGTTWTHFNAVSSTTTPNFASMFTGKLPKEHGIIEHSRHRLNPDVPTLAEILRERGWNTYAEMTGPLIPEVGLDRGFAHYRYRERTEYLHRGFYNYLKGFMPHLKKPWFFCLHLWEAHTPYQNPAPFNNPGFGQTPHDQALSLMDAYLGALQSEGALEDMAIVYTGDHGERLECDYSLNKRLGGHEWVVLKTYQEFVRRNPGVFNFDGWFRWLSQHLGETMARIYAHNVLGHGFHLTEEQIRIPLVIKDPDRCVAGRTVDALRSQADLFPTLLTMAGIEPEAHGPRVSSLLDFTSAKQIYIEANGSGGRAYESRCFLRGARTPRWKYWRIEGAGEELQVLWDLVEDPRETRNCIEKNRDAAKALDAFVDESLAVPEYGKAAETDEEAAKTVEEKTRGLGYL